MNVNGIWIEVEDSGEPAGAQLPVVVLVIGLGMQLTEWPISWVTAWIKAGWRVIRLDNRDAGLSDRCTLPHLSSVNMMMSLPAIMASDMLPPYTLSDMADDVLAVLQKLNVDRFHLVGLSMGGMIAQRIAIKALNRVKSLVCLLSSSNAPGLPLGNPAIFRDLGRWPGSNTSEDALLEYCLVFHRLRAGKHGVEDEVALKDILRSHLRRSTISADSLMRQTWAVSSDVRRYAQLGSIVSPCLVIHGTEDPLLPVEHGKDLVRRIHQAKFEEMVGMGHDIPRSLESVIFEKIMQFESAQEFGQETVNLAEQSQLGKPTNYLEHYDASLLFPIGRVTKRLEIGILDQEELPFVGGDLWTAFEVSWLSPQGKPEVAIVHFMVDCRSPNIIESKSLKLYLNSFNNSVFKNGREVEATIKRDLSEAAWHGVNPWKELEVEVSLVLPNQFHQEKFLEFQGIDLDKLSLECDGGAYNSDLLQLSNNPLLITETLTSNLLRSKCLITGQPDWGSIQISYTGPAIDHAGLLRYIVSFRNHHEFHEQCTERIYMDIMRKCAPKRLFVYSRYTRRGGLDINPYRSNYPVTLSYLERQARQ